jgi:hypothetical protein
MFIYAVNEGHRFRMAPDGGPRNPENTDAVKHETLFENAPVLAAGEVRVENGVIADINDESGSYDTRSAMQNDPQFASDILEAIRLGNIPTSDVVLAKLHNLGRIG